MKKIIFIFAIVAATLAACNSKSNKATGSQADSQSPNASPSSPTDANNKFSIKEIVSQYLQIENGLANDNGKDAADSGKAFVALIDNTDKISLTADKLKAWEDISADAKEMAEHIGENPDKLEHQREHFVMLSKDIYDLVKAFGSDQVLYKVFDSMSDDGKGAFWLSNTKEVKNPYMGKAMLNSGTIQEEIK